MLYKATTLKGFKLNSLDGEIGQVLEFYFDDRDWTIRYLVAETGTWLQGRQVLISPYALVAVDCDDQNISIDLPNKRIEESPAPDSDRPVSRQIEVAFYGVTTKEEQAGDPDLFSTEDVIGHHLQAADEAIGHVEDFLIDDKKWVIRYLVIDTKNWSRGQRVLMATQWIDRISWLEAKVFVNLQSDDIRQSPEYDKDLPLTRDEEIKLHEHYNRQGYWVYESDGEDVFL